MEKKEAPKVADDLRDFETPTMDRRRFKPGSTGLHRVQSFTESQASTRSTRSEDASAAGTSTGTAKRSQKLSNSEILRRQTRSTTSLAESRGDTAKDATESPCKTPKKSPLKSSLKSPGKSPYKPKRSVGYVADSDNDTDNEDAPNSRKSPLSRSLRKRQKSVSSLSENEEPAGIVEKPAGVKLLGERKKVLAAVDSDSEEEPVRKSPLKVRRTDNIVGRKDGSRPKISETVKDSETSKTSDIRSTQLSRPALSGRTSLSLRLTASQRESNSAKLKKLASPVKAVEAGQDKAQDDFVSPRKKKSVNRLEDFLRRSGIAVSQDDEVYQLDDDRPIIEKKMNDLLSSGKFKKQEVINSWRVHIDDEDNLKRALNDVSVGNGNQTSSTGSNVSLVRIFLQIPALQTAVSDHLLQKLNEAVLIADSIDDVPWALLLLRQFHFLETVVDTDSLTMRLEELLETCPIWFQRELIPFLPYIAIDAQHHAIAELLSKLMESHTDLTNVIMGCITELVIGKVYLEELREKVLNMLRSNLEVGRIPAMAKFVLHECPTVEICEKSLTVLRSLELQPLDGEKGDQYFANQSFLLSTLKMSIDMSKNMSSAALAVVKNTKDPPKPLDLVFLLLVYTDPTKKKNAETVIKQHVKTGYYRPSLLNSFYQDYKEVAKNLQPEALQLASNLLKSEDAVYTDFAIEWFRHQFVSQSAAICLQREIIGKIIVLTGNNDHTAKGALGILRRLTENEEDKQYLYAHCNHLRILLEKIEKFDLQEVATLSDLIFALCTSTNSASEALQDDLFILLQKQLSNTKTLTKSKGVLGAAMAIKHLAGKPETCKTADDLFAKVEACTKNCPRSQALFYDQIGRVIADTKNIEPNFLRNITDKFQDEFTNTYMTDLNDYNGELISKYGLIDVENEPQKCAINFGDGKYGAVVPAFFRLLRICFMRLNDGDLSDINVLLGVQVLMPDDTEIPEPWRLDLMICCINWFREIISGFVSQPDPLLQEQILKRLSDLMTLQAEFSAMLTLIDARYQPPPCYFHRIPAPQFVRAEKKVAKKGKRASLDKTSTLPEWEAWEIGSTLCAKNPTYFRQMDAKIIDLLDRRMDEDVTQSPKNISKGQICFIIKELLAMFEGGETSETLMRDLIHLLPKICSKLQDIVAELREKDDTKNRQAVKLMLTLLTTIFDWKGFKSAMYHSMLRDGLRTLAGQIDKSNSMLRSSKELVAESYKYFESIADVATEISLAFALVKMCRTLMKHSDTFSRQNKDKQAKLACGFLSLQWPEDKPNRAPYKAAVVGLLANWIQNEPEPLETVTAVMEWLPDEAAALQKPQDRLERLPAITKATFHHMFQRLFEGLINGTKISFAEATSDPQRIKVWHRVGNNVTKIVQICKSSSRAVLLPFLRYMTSLLRLFMTSAMPILEHNLRYQTEEVKEIIKMIQGGTRYLNRVCVDSVEKKDISLAKLVPTAKQVTERFLYLVKGMLVLNNSSGAFWMGNLVNKNLEGQQILSQSSDDATATSVNGSIHEDSGDDAVSEVLQSDVEDEASDDE